MTFQLKGEGAELRGLFSGCMSPGTTAAAQLAQAPGQGQPGAPGDEPGFS